MCPIDFYPLSVPLVGTFAFGLTVIPPPPAQRPQRQNHMHICAFRVLPADARLCPRRLPAPRGTSGTYSVLRSRPFGLFILIVCQKGPYQIDLSFPEGCTYGLF